MGYLTFTGVVIICIGSLRASEPQNNLETKTKSDVLDNFDNHKRNDSLSDPKQSLNAVFSALSQALNLLQNEYQNLNLDTVIGTRIVEGKIYYVFVCILIDLLLIMIPYHGYNHISLRSNRVSYGCLISDPICYMLKQCLFFLYFLCN